MDDFDGKLAFKVVAALVTAIDQHQPEIIDTLRATLGVTADDDPIGKIAFEAVSSVIEARTR